MAAQDASFIPKSGQQTFGLGQFYNGCASRPERGLEISALAVVDVTQKGAYLASVEQTLPAPPLKKGRPETTRLDQAIKQMQTVRPHLPEVVKAAEPYSCISRLIITRSKNRLLTINSPYIILVNRACNE